LSSAAEHFESSVVSSHGPLGDIPRRIGVSGVGRQRERVWRRSRRTSRPRCRTWSDLVPVEATDVGRAATRRWLAEPVRHLRDVRTELLLKFSILERMGYPCAPLAVAQQAWFAPIIASITEGTASDVVSIWRREHAQAVAEFLDQVIGAGQ
jgi:hypothetical protein